VPPEAKDLPEKWTDVDCQLTNFTAYYQILIRILLIDNPEYQKLLAEYSMLVPPPASAPGTPGSYATSAGGPSGAPSAASGAGGKPPLPIDVPYDTFIHPGWFNVGRRRDVPRDACFVGHHCGTYVWVNRDQLDALNKFTLVILDFNNIQNSGGSNLPSPPPATLGH
jgi:hypothetical protein